MMTKSRQPYLTKKLKPSPELMAVQDMMPMSESDFALLKRDIEENKEIRDPIKVYRHEDNNFLILGGYNRWKIALDMGLETVEIEIVDVVDPKKRRELALKDNLSRRHLSAEQKRNIAAYLLKNDHTKSDRRIASDIGVDHKTVAAERKKLEKSGVIDKEAKRQGADGKAYKRGIKSGGEFPHLGSKAKTFVSGKESKTKESDIRQIKSDVKSFLTALPEKKQRAAAEELMKFLTAFTKNK